MRGQWDNERPLSPSLLNSGLALLFGLLAVLAVAGLLLAIGLLIQGDWLGGLWQATLSLAGPFAVWMIALMLRDNLIVQNRAYDRLEEGALAALTRSAARTRPADGRAQDDGPTYPDA